MNPIRRFESPLMLYGAPVGLYTGKIRSYLRKQGIAYIERLPTDPVFRNEILPAIGRFINPVIRTPDGRIVQDSADIIDFLECEGYACSASTPQAPVQKIVALILDLFGGEGLIRPAMHYRWSYRAQNEAFLRHEFGLSYRPGRLSAEDVEKQLSSFMNYLNAYLPKLGIRLETRAAVEASYEDLLGRLDAHFRQHPYAMGGVPTIADYGLIAPLYAHLARDPYPANQMKLQAPSLYRWTERMNAADADTPEFPRYPEALAADDRIPETLGAIFDFIAQDYLPELRMTVEACNGLIADQDPATITGTPIPRAATSARFELRGQSIETIVQPYTLYKLQRVTDAYAALAADAQTRVRDALPQPLHEILNLKAERRVERAQHLEIWGERH